MEKNMKVELNNKAYPFLFKGGGKIEIIIEDKFDLLFFKEWTNQSYDKQTGEIKPKIEYARNVKFVGDSQMGFLMNCFPIISPNEDLVIIYYDYKKLL